MCACSTHINQNWNTALKQLLVLQSLKSHAVAAFYYSESFQDLLHIYAFSCLLGRANYGKSVTVPSIPLCIDPMSARTLSNVRWRILLKWLKTLLFLSECPALLLLLALFQWVVSIEHFTFRGDFLENLAYALGQLRHSHTLLLCLPQDQQHKRVGKTEETSNIWKCPCEIFQSLSAQKPLSCVSKAQIKGHSLLYWKPVPTVIETHGATSGWHQLNSYTYL